jgi:hypothetical protein
MSLRIFLEATDIALSGYLAGHMYLVLRDVEVDANGNVTSNVRTDADQTLRGSFGINLTTYNGLLTGSIDKYGPNETPQSRHSLDITAKIMAGGDFSSVMSAWQALGTDVNEISGQYLYEFPTPAVAEADRPGAARHAAARHRPAGARSRRQRHPADGAGDLRRHVRHQQQPVRHADRLGRLQRRHPGSRPQRQRQDRRHRLRNESNLPVISAPWRRRCRAIVTRACESGTLLVRVPAWGTAQICF